MYFIAWVSGIQTSPCRLYQGQECHNATHREDHCGKNLSISRYKVKVEEIEIEIEKDFIGKGNLEITFE